MRHIIHRKRLEVEIARPSEQAYALQAELAAAFREDLPRALAPIFDAAAPAEGSLRLDRLVVEVEVEDGSDLRGVLVGEICAALRDALASADALHASEKARETAARLIESARSDELLFEHFLEKGTLPWWIPTEEPPRLASRIEKLVEAGKLFGILREGDCERRVKRLFASFPDVAHRVATELAGSAGGDEAETLVRMLASPKPGVSAARWKRVVAEELVLLHAKGEVQAPTEAAEVVAAAVARAGARLTPSSSSTDAPGRVPATSPAHEVQAAEVAAASSVPRVQAATVDDDERKPAVGSMTAPTTEHPLPSPASPSIPSPGQAESPPPASAGRPHVTTLPESLYVNDSGLVLLHPFLKTFFGAVELLDGGRFVDEHAKGRAACLLHWLATDEPVEDEHGLALPKVLCGIPIEAVVEPIFEPTAKEREEGDALLAHVASLWPALKSRSPRLLRDMFLRRPGLLSEVDAGWQLHLESRGWDLLLDQLPWGFSHVKLGWMPRLLVVIR